MAINLDWNHRGFFKEGKPVRIDISLNITSLQNFKGVVIVLPAGLDKDLDWTEQICLARSLKEDCQILWEIDLELSQLSYPYEDEMQLRSFALALNHFSKEIYPEFSARSIGVLLYKGEAEFIKERFWTVGRGEAFEEYQKMGGDLSSELKLLLFARDLFIDYLQIFLSSLVDQLPVFLFLAPPAKLSLAELSLLLSKEKMEHFLFALSGDKASYLTPFSWNKDSLVSIVQPSIGVCFPSDEAVSTSVLQRFDRLFTALTLKKIPFRIVYESHLNEEWDGINTLYVFSDLITSLGKRKIAGFAASGGEAIMLEKECTEKTIPLPREENE